MASSFKPMGGITLTSTSMSLFCSQLVLAVALLNST